MYLKLKPITCDESSVFIALMSEFFLVSVNPTAFKNGLLNLCYFPIMILKHSLVTKNY